MARPGHARHYCDKAASLIVDFAVPMYETDYMSDYLDPNNEELLKDFYAEAELQVDALEQNILVLEQDGRNHDAIDEIFRAAHTLKGAAATVQMTELTEFTHVVEDVLDDIRSGKVAVGGDLSDLLLASIDIIKNMLDARSRGKIFTQDISAVKSSLRSLIEEKKPNNKPESKPSMPAPAKKTSQTGLVDHGLTEYELLELREAADGVPVFLVRVKFDEENPMNSVGGIQAFAALKDVGTILKTQPEFEKLYEDTFHPTVAYFLASERDQVSIAKAVDISDVTLGSEIIDLSSESAQPSAQPESVDSGKSNHQVSTNKTQDSLTEASNPDLQEQSGLKENEVEPSLALPVADNTTKEHDLKKSNTGGSILRVESKRIDELLNLVSETVINKATFNQVNTLFSDVQNSFQTVQTDYRKLIKELFDSLPDYLERIQSGANVKDVKKEILDQFSSLLTIYDPVFNSLKNSVAKFKSTAQNLSRITSELQEGVMRIRMVPINQIFSRFPRLVRDLSKQLGKDVSLRIEGEDTELDKSVIEDLLDPLIHCVRNSIDHGIESPETRQKASKSAFGEVLLKASNEGNMILIEIIDDGKGIDLEAIRKKAIDRGIIHPNKSLTDVEAYNLIFDAGFSTASKVTNISGRGVGLDVVRKQIEKLNGSVSVQSERGKGSRFLMKIPLTLAIIQGLLVKVGAEIYAIPITAVLDSHRISPSEIRMIDNYEVFNVREDVVSLLRLNRLFRIESDEHKDHYFVVIVGSGDKKMGLIVDSLIGEEDVVIKPLRDHYTNAPGIAGANITGDGTVSLIIDVSQLLELGQKREVENRRHRESTLK